MALFQRRRRGRVDPNAPLGLVVGPRARQVFNDRGECIYDELADMELAYRMRGRPIMTFEEEQAETDYKGNSFI